MKKGAPMIIFTGVGSYYYLFDLTVVEQVHQVHSYFVFHREI